MAVCPKLRLIGLIDRVPDDVLLLRELLLLERVHLLYDVEGCLKILDALVKVLHLKVCVT